MKVSALIRKLKTLPQDAEIVIDNNRMYIDGIYKATKVELWEKENIVMIETDYKRKVSVI